MKTKTYIRLSLIAPYAIWIILAGSMYVYSNLYSAAQASPVLAAVTIPVFFYVVGILLWGIPYSLLAVILGIWSRNQAAKKIANVFAFSPLALAVLITIQTLTLFLLESGTGSSDSGAMILMLSVFSIVYGYGIIGIVGGIFKLLNRSGYVKDEEETPSILNTEINLSA